MSKGTGIVIAGTAYPKEKKARTVKRKATGGSGRGGQKRARTELSGSGDYNYMFKGPTPFADVGEHLGKRFLPSSYAKYARGAGHLIGRLFGSGDYVQGPIPSNNVFYNGKELPNFAAKGGYANVICHREYIKDITSSSVAGNFQLESFDVNPGLPTTFPWLAVVAQCYEEYKIHGMVFEFKSTSADALNSTNTALGTVIMATSYNAAAPDFISKQQMENYEFASSARPSVSQMHGLECAADQTPIVQRIVRSGSVPSGQDQRWFDLANFQIASVGMQGTSVNIGELWCTYCIEFLKPKLPLTVGGLTDSLHVTRTGTTTTAINFGLVGLQNVGNLVNNYTLNSVTSFSVSGLDVTDQYMVNINMLVPGAITTAATFSVTSGTAQTYFGNAGAIDVVSSFSSGIATAQRQAFTTIVKPDSTGVIAIGCTAGTATATGVPTIDMFVTKLDSSITT